MPVSAKTVDNDRAGEFAVNLVAILVGESKSDPFDDVKGVRGVHGHRGSPSVRAHDGRITCLGNGVLVNVR